MIDEEVANARSQPKITIGSLFTTALRWPLFIAIMMMLSQQLSGINAAMFYSKKIFEGAGLVGNMPKYATILMGLINVIMTIVSVWLVDHPNFGRRSLHIAGLLGMCFSSIMISASITLYKYETADHIRPYLWASYLSILFVNLFVISFATGPGSIPWFFVSETFKSNARGPASSVACMTNWFANFCVGYAFLQLNDIMGQYTFLIFAGFVAFFAAFTYLFVPETKGKSVETIYDEMHIVMD